MERTPSKLIDSIKEFFSEFELLLALLLLSWSVVVTFLPSSSEFSTTTVNGFPSPPFAGSVVSTVSDLFVLFTSFSLDFSTVVVPTAFRELELADDDLDEAADDDDDDEPDEEEEDEDEEDADELDDEVDMDDEEEEVRKRGLVVDSPGGCGAAATILFNSVESLSMNSSLLRLLLLSTMVSLLVELLVPAAAAGASPLF
jgi:hypothetical protein